MFTLITLVPQVFVFTFVTLVFLLCTFDHLGHLGQGGHSKFWKVKYLWSEILHLIHDLFLYLCVFSYGDGCKLNEII